MAQMDRNSLTAASLASPNHDSGAIDPPSSSPEGASVVQRQNGMSSLSVRASAKFRRRSRPAASDRDEELFLPDSAIQTPPRKDDQARGLDMLVPHQVSDETQIDEPDLDKPPPGLSSIEPAT